MTLRPIVFYVSGHGFGHASRVIELIHAVKQRRPDQPVIVRTAAPATRFQQALRVAVDFHAMVCDTGMVQVDSLTIDAPDSIRQAAEFYRHLAPKVDQESAFLRQTHAGVVVGDIPPLAFAAAAAAGVPAVALGNFTWDWIYEDYPECLDQAPDLLSTIRRAYWTASLALRLPMAGGFSPLLGVVRDIPFIARRSRHHPAEIRQALGLSADGPVVLISFGGYGLPGLDIAHLSALRGYTTITTDFAFAGAPQEVARSAAGNVVRFAEQWVHETGYGYEDLVRAADVVVTKPGYGIVSEAIANDTAILYTSRDRFREYDVLVEAMPKFARCLFIEQADLLAGVWGPSLDRLLALPQPTTHADVGGASAAAEAILGIIP